MATVGYYVINDQGLALTINWKTQAETWVDPFKTGGWIARHQAEDHAKRTGGRVVASNTAEFRELIRPAMQALEAKWAAEKAAEAARIARAEAHPWYGADTLREALGDWD